MIPSVGFDGRVLYLHEGDRCFVRAQSNPPRVVESLRHAFRRLLAMSVGRILATASESASVVWLALIWVL